MLPLVSAKALHRRTLRVGDEVFANASLLPCFDRTGRSTHVMIVHAEAAEIYLFPWRSGGFVVPLWGTITLAGESAWLKPITEDRLALLAGLWHYDPRWVLEAPRYQSHWAIAQLEATNSARSFTGDVRALWFRRDLSRISWVEIRSFSEFNLQRWRPDLLPDRPVAPRRTANRPSATGWRFDPVWARWTA